MFNQPKNLIIIVLLIAVLGMVYLQFSATSEKDVIPADEAVNLALAFVNENLLAGVTQASLAGDVQEQAGLYAFQMKIANEEYTAYVTKDGRIFFPEGIELTESSEPEQEEEEEEQEQDGQTIGNFSVHQEEICEEDGKPIIYFFGSERCGYCQWEHPIMEQVAEKFEGYISFHNNMDSEEDRDVFEKYSTGGIPTLVFGCKYSRVGAGTNFGEEIEADNLTAIICSLTDNQPAEVCQLVEDLVQQIE